ncbi:MAG: oxidoreductase [Fimbriimonadaceae bacterium]|nr:oxidoreductase [Fimbriimonadaceae bacterium]
MAKVWYITGCSTGFGRELCAQLLDRGDQVVATARDRHTVVEFERSHPNQALACAVDVTKPDQIQSSVQAGLARFGHIDVLVNNAGYGVIGAVEEVSDAELRAMFEVNVFGVVNVLKAVLPSMRKQRSGRILNVSSTAGHIAFPGSATYSCTKHALEGLSDGLAQELAPLGIRVTLIEPGPFRTDFAGRSIVIAKEEIADYAETAGKRRTGIKEFDGHQQGDPVLGVQAMIAIADEADPPLRLALGGPAYTMIREKLARVSAELDRWESLGKPTDYPE